MADWAPPESDFSSNWQPPEADFSAAAPGAPTGYDPTEGMSGTDKFLAGAGKAFVDTMRGVRQIGANLGITHEKPEDVQSEIDDAKERDKALMNTKAGMAGNITGQAAPMLLAPGAGIVGSAVEGAGMAALQPVESGGSRLQNAGMGALGGAGGAAVGKLASGALAGFGGAGGRQAATDLLKSEGIPVSVAQATKGKLAQSVERASAMTSDDASEFAATQGQAFNRAVLRRIGVNDPKVTAATPDVLGPAKKSITNVMDNVAANTRPRVDNALLNDMASVEQDAARQLPASDIQPIRQNLDDILQNASENNGYLDGTFVQKLNSNLGALSRNPSTAPVAEDLQEAVHNAVQRYASPDDAAALMQAQKQFRALKQIENAVDPSSGNISVPKLINSLNSKSYGGRNQTLYAKGDQSLVDLARAAKQVIPDNLGNSGTAERALPALTALEIAASGEPLKAGLKAGVGVGGLNVAGKAMRNQGVVGSYLKSGIPGARAAAPAIERVAPSVGYGTAEAQPRDDTTPRASGGKVDHEALVNRLVQRWKAAKKATDKTSEELLKVPDATITRALKIAQEHI